MEDDGSSGVMCMNEMCSSSSNSNSNSAAAHVVEWEKGWPLRSGGFASLCLNCGTAYKQLVFCEMFHSEDSGWRECTSCGKRLHCGCVASSSFVHLLDTGGVNCKGCTMTSNLLLSTPSQEKTKACDLSTENRIDRDSDKMAPVQACDVALNDCQEYLPPSQNADTTPRKMEDDFSGSLEIGYKLLSNFNQSSTVPSKYYDVLQESTSARNIHNNSLVQTNLSISLSASSNSNPIAEERELSSGISSFQQGCRSRHLLPRLPNSIHPSGLETNSSTISQLRVARPPVEGRLKNQLLPRYWPRITDQELQQISGDSNSTIVPLFEKVLSASDAGRIGRLVLPKACAEAYFPPISQPEGLSLRIQDVKGKEWIFQFRFWPNNNSRMYVLEGVTPCIQSMQLQAGDTVTFSRMDPEGKLLMGFRKASNTISQQQQDPHPGMNNAAFQRESHLAAAENIPIMSGYSGLLQSLNGSRTLSKHVYTGNNNLPPQQLLLPERKRSRNIGPKSKRLLFDGNDALELKLSWEEVQDMLRPPPTVKPSTMSVEDYEFEEFEEPPVFGKRSIFIVRLSGDHEQWAQCDSCFKWRKLPIDILLPPKWTCQDNIKDQTRSSCSAPDELDARELENLLRMNKDFKKRRIATSLKSTHENESQDQEKNAATVGGDISEPGSSSVATTTKHPRHRPGCSCIVCIQPPSGKGKHKPTCTCNVCMTVKRRFKTLMMRKKKRQSEREAEIAQMNQFGSAVKEGEVDNISPSQLDRLDHTKRSESELLTRFQENVEIHKGGLLDLNCCPGREHTGRPQVSMTSLVQEASLPLDIYLRQNGLTTLVPEQQGTTSQATTDNMTQAQEDQVLSAVNQEHEDSDDSSGKDQRENDLP